MPARDATDKARPMLRVAGARWTTQVRADTFSGAC